MKSKLHELLIISALLGESGNVSPINPKQVTGKLPNKPIPKGCKEYFFNQDGDFSTERMLKSECVFKCVASNDKTAKKKFDKWNKPITK